MHLTARTKAPIVALALLAAAGGTVMARQNAGAPPAQPVAAAQAGGEEGGAISPQMIGRVVQGLRATPGCLGADLGQLQSGKYVIFGWFESKKALVDWYKSDVHQAVTNATWPERDKNRVPLKDVPEDVGPIMAVACATPIPPEELKPGQAPGSVRLGIEIYQPLPGGVRFGGGSFAPPGFKNDIRAIDPGAVYVAPAKPAR